MTTSFIRDNDLFTIKKENFNELYKMVDAVLETKGNPLQEQVLANALKDRLDLALEDDEEELIFNELEVQCLSSIVE